MHNSHTVKRTKQYGRRSGSAYIWHTTTSGESASRRVSDAQGSISSGTRANQSKRHFRQRYFFIIALTHTTTHTHITHTHIHTNKKIHAGAYGVLRVNYELASGRALFSVAGSTSFAYVFEC